EWLLERLELGSDSAVVVWRDTAAQVGSGRELPAGDALVVADGAELPVLPPTGSRVFEPKAPGERRTVSYPVPRGTRSLGVVVRLPGGEASKPVAVRLS